MPNPAGALSKIRRIGQAAEKAGQKTATRTVKPPLTREAIEMPAAKPYERSLQQGYEHDWLHGTTGDITEFKPELRGETTGAASAKKGFFFVRDPISPPPSMVEKSKSEQDEVAKIFSQHNIPVNENAWKRPFEGTGAETASGYAVIGGSRTYKEAMRKAKAAKKRGDWAEYEKYFQIAEDAEIQSMQEAQRLVAEYGERRDEMTDAIQKAIYNRPLPQPEAEKLDEWYKSVMPYGWYNFYNKAQFDNLAKELVKKVGPEKAEAAIDAIQKFQSTSAQRRLAEGSQEGANVMPVALRYSNPYVHDFEGSSYRDETYSDLVDKAIRGGHDALILRNTYDPGGGPAQLVDVGVVFEPGQIRSKFAEFDPMEVGNPDITKAKGGKVDHDLKAWHEKTMAKGGEVDHDLKKWHETRMAAGGDPYAAQQAQQSQKAADIQAYKQGKLGADDLLKYFPGLTATMVEAQLQTPPQAEPQMADGGEVRMQFGGNPADIQAQLAAGVPVHMSRGPEGTIARGLIEQQEAERRRKAEAQAARVQGLPLSERLKGMYEAGRTVQSALGQEIAKPFVGLIGGESKIKELEEGMPIPETEAGRYYLEKTGEFLEPVGKAFEAMKIPEVPFLPELIPMTGLPKIGGQIAGATKRAGQKLDEAIPEGLKDLPVGMSTKSVGPEGEKVSINELIRRLEAGEEMTPAERQKAEYSKAQKEKYAQANIAKAQKEPAPKEEEIRVPATEQGFFSSVEKAAANLKREEGSGDAFLSDIMKFNPSKGELEAIGIVDFLKGKENLTKQDIVDYINNNQIQIEEVVRGTMLSDEERRLMNDINYRAQRGMEVSDEEEEFLKKIREKQSLYKEPRFEDERLILPGGTNYKELLLKFPMKQNAPVSTEKSAATMLFENNMKEKYGGETFPSIYNRLTPDEIEKYDMYVREDINARKTESILQDKRNNFRTNHWPDDPNTFAHVRMQDMDIGGKRTLMIEEIQSDWHQIGRTKGYRTNDADKAEKDFKSYSAELASKYDLNPEQNLSMYATIKRMLPEEVEKYESLQSAWVNSKDSVPDAPFKKDWYQLAIKRIMKYAADNDYDQVALVGPEEQIRRSSLSTYVDGLNFQKNKDGTIKIDAEKDGSIVFNDTVKPEDLDLYVSKDVAKRILESKETDGTLTGDDLKIGGEGMRQYYDRNYPKYLEKQYNKYGINLRKKELRTRGFDVDDVEVEGIGETDRTGREVMGYTVRDPESGDVVGFGTSMEEALNEANKGIQKTDIWVMDLPAKLKSDVKIGQSYKKGGLVTDKSAIWKKYMKMAKGGNVDHALMNWHKKKQKTGTFDLLSIKGPNYLIEEFEAQKQIKVPKKGALEQIRK